MPKTPWTPERRWCSLVKAGAVADDRSPGDLTYVVERLHSALAPTMGEPTNAQVARTLLEHAMDLLAQHPSEPRASLDGYTQGTIERLLADLLRDGGPIARPQVRALCTQAARLLPASTAVMLAEAGLLLDEDNYEEAERVLRRVLAVDPDHERALLLLRVARLDPQRPPVQ